jgi:DNA-binding transcriptional ArsR family regulator
MPDGQAVAEQVFSALADPSPRAILAAGGPATATDLAGRLPITRQAIAKHLALLAGAGLVAAAPGERRRVRYRVRSAPMQRCCNNKKDKKRKTNNDQSQDRDT